MNKTKVLIILIWIFQLIYWLYFNSGYNWLMSILITSMVIVNTFSWNITVKTLKAK